MKTLAGWDGPSFLCEGVYRYSRTIAWIQLYIDVEGSGFYGGTTGADTDFEVDREDGQWKRFETDLAKTPGGELILRLGRRHHLGCGVRADQRWRGHRGEDRNH